MWEKKSIIFTYIIPERTRSKTYSRGHSHLGKVSRRRCPTPYYENTAKENRYFCKCWIFFMSKVKRTTIASLTFQVHKIIILVYVDLQFLFLLLSSNNCYICLFSFVHRQHENAMFIYPSVRFLRFKPFSNIFLIIWHVINRTVQKQIKIEVFKMLYSYIYVANIIDCLKFKNT